MYEGLVLSEVPLDALENEIIYSIYTTQQEYDELSNNSNINSSKKRVELLRSIANFMDINSTNLMLNWLNITDTHEDSFKIQNIFSILFNKPNNKLLKISISFLYTLDCIKFLSSQLKLHLYKNQSIVYKPFKNPISRVLMMNCANNTFDTTDGLIVSPKDIIFKQQFDNFIPGNYSSYQIDYLNDEFERDFIITVIIPLSIIAFMLTISISLACFLNKLNKRSNKRNKNGPIYKQKSYLTKGVPVILYDEMTDKPIEEEDYDHGHRMPLIMKNEKPPQPAPPEYRKSSNYVVDDTNELRNNSAPLAIAESTTDDTIAFLRSNSNNKKEDLFYQPPQPIITIKDVSRRLHPTQQQQQKEFSQMTPQLLP